MAKLKFKDENDNFIPVVQDVKVNNQSVFDGKVANVSVPDVSDFITKDVNDLTNYYKKSETYQKSEVDTLLNAKQNTIDSSHTLDSDLVSDTNQTNKFVTSADITNWNGKADASHFVTLTQTEYDNLQTKDPNTYYFIEEE